MDTVRKNIALLGATGSIGAQVCEVARAFPDNFKIRVMTGNRNINKLAQLSDEFDPDLIWVPDEAGADLLLKAKRRRSREIITGQGGLSVCAGYGGADFTVNALVGRAGLVPTLSAIESGKSVALANKETLVSAGSLVTEAAKKNGVEIIPVDSEHSAISQCLAGSEAKHIDKLILTASGGPFRKWDAEKIRSAKAADALKHPNWRMGDKITVDCATMMNKGFEFIEAMWLFEASPGQIEILVHPQSVVHSMVRFTDGSVIAQLGAPDMRNPILRALSYPNRLKNDFKKLDLTECGALTFEKCDDERFPCLGIAIGAAREGGTLPAVLNASNELAVGAFLRGELGFYGISDIVGRAVSEYKNKPLADIAGVAEAEAWAEEHFAACMKEAV